MLRRVAVCGLALLISACATVKPEPAPTGTSTGTSPDIIRPGAGGNSRNHTNSPPPIIITPPQNPQPRPYQPPRESGSLSTAAAFAGLPFWSTVDTRPALAAFKRNCAQWARKDPHELFSAQMPDFGLMRDWHQVCAAAPAPAAITADHARHFFQSHFYPLQMSTPGREKGLVTGYYQPELAARRAPSAEFSEPILSVPAREANRKLPRAAINGQSANVIAYGRPMDVFFMQIQGSGILRFANGSRVAAGYANNNGYPYTSIGRVLIDRGELTKDRSSKQDIEAWIRRKGPAAGRALMNENKRYIFFQEKPLVPGEGPFGSLGIPLTSMGSMAVDPNHHPHGAPIWLTVKLPQFGGDYRGAETGQLLIPQDIGKAIRGPNRGDLYFGSGDEAGKKAGVMKHMAHWTILMPIPLARQLLPRS